jgi:cytosine/adenosine deaminase-related metal-dependent hydrolase
MSETLVLTARWIFPVASGPIENGTISLKEGRIANVEPKAARTPDLDLGNAAIIPGLVNAHTHLDLSGLRGKAPPGPDFTGWLKSVIAHRRARLPEQVQDDARAGLAEALRHGTTLIADIAGEGATWAILAEARCRSVVFREILGLPAHRALPVWKEAMKWAAEHPDADSCQAGLSPHAPYSVHHSLIRAAANVGLINSIHVAETAAEIELLDQHRGPFVEFLSELGVWEEDGLARSIDWILWQSSRSWSTLLVHGNYLPPDAAIPASATIVYCPRTHAAFGHPPHPFREFLARGVRVALGTDSLASNPDLDLLAEARFIHERFPDFPGDQLLKLATLSGAEALRLGHEVGSLETGKSAELVVVALPDEEAVDPHRLLFEPKSAAAVPRQTMWKGNWRR